MTTPPAFNAPKRDFIGKPAPAGYVAGIGRGATGFTTRSDIGPAREAAMSSAGPSTGQSKSGQVVKRRGEDDDDDEEDLNESNYDEFTGYGGSLFSKDPYEEDDEEADKIYAEIDRHLDERGKALRELKQKQDLEEFRQKRPKIQQQFSDLKSNLRQVSELEWMNIPDVGDSRNRKQRIARQDKFTPVPDSLLAHQAKLSTGGDKIVYLDPAARMDSDDEDADSRLGIVDKKPSATSGATNADTEKLSVGEMSEFRSSYLDLQLSNVTSSNTQEFKKPATNAHDYLTNLQSMVPQQITDQTILEEYRKQFTSLRTSNPSFENAWVASVRLEEAAGKLSKARELILEACEKCPKSADLWLESIRLHSSEYSKRLMVRALKAQPRSAKLWLKAAEFETNEESRRRVYRNARTMVPDSVELWRRSAELEKPSEAREILKEAVQCCPNAVDLWLALARLESYEKAKQVLVQASEKNPTDRSIWITAAKLQEQVGNLELVGSIIKRAIEELSSKGVEIKRNEWFAEAVDADRAKARATCREIIRHVIHRTATGADQPNSSKLATWLDDVKQFVDGDSIGCARAVFSCMVEDKEFSRNESVWLQYAHFEQQHQTAEPGGRLVEVLSAAVRPEHAPKSEALWLMLTDGLRPDLDACRRVLSDALKANPASSKIVLAAVELECENGNHDEARRILAAASNSAKTGQLVMRASRLEWSLGNLDEAARILEQAVEEYKDCADFYLSLGQIEEQRGDNEKAKGCYSNGLKFNPTSVQLWISMARLEEKGGLIARARSKLEMARLRNPRNVQLWLEAAQLEYRHFLAAAKSSGAAARGRRPDVVITLLAKGIKECKDCQDVGKLMAMQAEVSKRKLT